MTKKIVRLKITDFFESENESNIISFLTMIKKDIPTFTVILWYFQDEMCKESLSKFRQKYKDEIEMLELDIIQLSGIENSVWYDIINTKDQEQLEHYKFRSVYNDNDDIINCIMEFNSLIKFDTQKNNGYRNAKDRNNGFKAVGK